jgi:hypothetical protein
MTSDEFSSSETHRTLTRRRVVAVLAGASATTVAAVGVASEETDAQVSGEFTVPDASYSADDPSPTPVADVTASIAYEVGSLTAVDVSLWAGREEPADRIAAETIETTSTMAETDVQLSGPITDADGFAPEDFAPAAETTATVDVVLGLELTIRDGETEVATDTATHTTTIEIENTGTAITVQVGGSGEIRFE